MWQKGRFWLRGLGLLLMLLAMSRRAEAAPSAQIDVYTMGPGDDLFSRFGHAAICVTDELSPQGRCYNYGTADFSTPGPLTWGVIRGDGQFWVSVVSLPRMMLLYQLEDRTLYRQRLPLSDAQTAAIVTALHRADRPEQTLYNYRHFDDNCTTRIRDLIDQVTDGELRRDNLSPSHPSLRSRVETGFATSPALRTLQQAVLGRRVDAATSGWDSMFLPEVLRSELQQRSDRPHRSSRYALLFAGCLHRRYASGTISPRSTSAWRDPPSLLDQRKRPATEWAICWASSGGTALPTCTYCCVRPPSKK